MNWRITINPEVGNDDELESFVKALPCSFDDYGETVFKRRNTIKRIPLTAAAIIAKRFRKPNLFQAIYYTLTSSSKARKAYFNAIELRKRGISTPFPAAYAEGTKGLLLNDTYYITAEDCSPCIATLLNDPPEFDKALARDFALFAAMLHRKGILHGDLNSTNTLFQERKDGRFTFSVIDINRMKFMPENQLPPLDECLENLTRFTGRMDLFRYVAECYANEMAQQWTMTTYELVHKAMRQKQSHDKKWRRRKSFLKIFK